MDHGYSYGREEYQLSYKFRRCLRVFYKFFFNQIKSDCYIYDLTLSIDYSPLIS